MIRTAVRYALAALATLALAACDGAILPDDPGVEITPDRSQYTAGSDVMLTVRNLDDEPLVYSFCTRAIQRRTVAGWFTERLEALPCLAVLLSLDPGESVTGRVELPADIPAGTYRVYLPGIGAIPDHATPGIEAQKSSKPFTVTVD